jgi:protein-tyrosine phosphatase
MQKILFVCLGNICRSPLAEGIMLHINNQYHLNLHIDSAGTANYHVGEAPDKRTIANAKKMASIFLL